MLQSPLRGRTVEMSKIGTVLSRAIEGRGGVVLVEGRAGLGKSRLLEEAQAMAAGIDVRTCFGRADADDNAVQLAPVMAACFAGAAPLLSRSDRSTLRAVGADRYWVLLELRTCSNEPRSTVRC